MLLQFKPYRHYATFLILFRLLCIVALPLQAVALTEPLPNSSLEKAMDTAFASLEEPSPEAIKIGVDALNTVPDEDERTVSQKMEVFQQLLDTAVLSVEHGFDQYPVPVRQMTEDLSAYQATLTHTSLPAFNDFAKSQFDHLQATIQNLPEQPLQRSEEPVKQKKVVVSAKESAPISYQTLLGLLVGGILLLASGWAIGRRTKQE